MIMTFSPGWKDQHTDFLVQALLCLQNEEDAYRLLDDLCTVSEIKAMSQRLEVARLLAGNIKYNEIAADTGASTATISRVKRCLNYGADGYRRILNNLNGEKNNEE